MNINLLPYAIFWGVLAIAVVLLIIYRKAITNREDDSIHLEGNVATEQVALAHRLQLVDRLGKTLTIVVAVYGVILAALYLYQVWNAVPTY